MQRDSARLRKEPLEGGAPEPGGRSAQDIDIAAEAVLHYTSELPDFPVDHLFDGRDGPDGTRWLAAEVNVRQELIIAFDRPRSLARIRYEVAEREAERTQEVRLEASRDAGGSYEPVLVQSYNFSPRGATFQVEDLALPLAGITHLRLTIIPNKQGSGRASLTSLRLVAGEG